MENYSILLVEDEPADQEEFKGLMEKCTNAKFEIMVASTLESALRILAKTCVDCVILDLNLPDVQVASYENFYQPGRTALEVIHDTYPTIAVIILTVTDDDLLGNWLIRHGAQDYYVKKRFGTVHFCRSIVYAIERQGQFRRALEAQEQVRTSLSRMKQLLTLTDPLH